MSTCFLFAHDFTQDHCLSLRLNDANQLDAPLERRSFDEIKALQTNIRTIVVLPMHCATLHSVELSWLSESKARSALPFALEEHVAQSVSTLHVAFDQQHYKDKHYLVVAIDRTLIHDLMQRLSNASIAFDMITLDWFALAFDEVVANETELLIYDAQFSGALSIELAGLYWTERSSTSPIFLFNDSSLAFQDVAKLQSLLTSNQSVSFYEWTAQRLLQTTPINLCQGMFHHNTQQELKNRWSRIATALVTTFLLSFLVVKGSILYYLNNKITTIDQNIATIYHAFFPNATQVISPRFRVERMIKERNTQTDRALWELQNQLAIALEQQPGFTIEQIHYQNQLLVIKLIAPDFAALENFEHRLQQAGVKVTQSQAASKKQQVDATLELRL